MGMECLIGDCEPVFFLTPKEDHRMFGRLGRAMRRSENVQVLYREIVAQARQPIFYEKAGVVDSFDGRFDCLVLHMALVLRRLKKGDEKARGFSQYLYDYMFHALDVALREDSIGDTGISRRIRMMTEAFGGRLLAYHRGLEEAIAGDETAEACRSLRDAIRRNLYGTLDEHGVCEVYLEPLAVYALSYEKALNELSPAEVESGILPKLLPGFLS